MEGVIYLVHAPTVKRVKIGFTTNIENRLNELNTCSPVRIELVGTIDGDMRAEKLLHEKFAKYRVKGEWFEAVEVIFDEFDCSSMFLQFGFNLLRDATP